MRIFLKYKQKKSTNLTISCHDNHSPRLYLINTLNDWPKMTLGYRTGEMWAGSFYKLNCLIASDMGPL